MFCVWCKSCASYLDVLQDVLERAIQMFGVLYVLPGLGGANVNPTSQSAHAALVSLTLWLAASSRFHLWAHAHKRGQMRDGEGRGGAKDGRRAHARMPGMLSMGICLTPSLKHERPGYPLTSASPTWWSPTYGHSCRFLWRKTPGFRKELRTWKRSGTSCGASSTVLSRPQRVSARIGVNIVTVRRTFQVTKCEALWP